jgi:hypothetical protein
VGDRPTSGAELPVRAAEIVPDVLRLCGSGWTSPGAAERVQPAIRQTHRTGDHDDLVLIATATGRLTHAEIGPGKAFLTQSAIFRSS